MPETLPDEQLLAALSKVFSTHGYDGATLSMVSEATGLQKSSLYHRFPNGKKQMAESVLVAAATHIAGHVLAPLQGTGSIRSRVKQTAARISDLYAHGKQVCLLDSLSVGPIDPAVARLLNKAYSIWIDAFSEAAIEAGLPKRTAQARAIDAFVRLEGALVVARVSGDTTVFKRVVDSLPDLLCKS